MKIDSVLAGSPKPAQPPEQSKDVLKWLGERFGREHRVTGINGGGFTERSLPEAEVMIRELKAMRPDAQRAVMGRVNELLDTRTDEALKRSLALSDEVGLVNNVSIPDGNALYDYAKSLGIEPSWEKRADPLRGWRP